MIVIKDTVTIKTTPSDIFHWFEHLDEHYLSWHPSHVSSSYLKKNTLEVGAILYAEEYLHGKLHKLKFYITKVIPNQEFKYRVIPGISGGFRFLESKKGVDVEAELRLGWNFPFIGGLIDVILNLLFSKIINDLRQHMCEEGTNLRTLLEQRKSTNDNVLPNAEI